MNTYNDKLTDTERGEAGAITEQRARVDVLEVMTDAAESAMNDERFATARYISEACAAVEGLRTIANRILLAHDSQNNGAVMGEATLCRYFANALRHAIARVDGEA